MAESENTTESQRRENFLGKTVVTGICLLAGIAFLRGGYEAYRDGDGIGYVLVGLVLGVSFLRLAWKAMGK